MVLYYLKPYALNLVMNFKVVWKYELCSSCFGHVLFCSYVLAWDVSLHQSQSQSQQNPVFGLHSCLNRGV
ncbi:hypothetical protein QVD17_32503 [Tagetes erecta]|uniref:Uncharacterized protein n=1 Tax=Tagetes erecta TaxID=13708 RepID=A0AAD8JXI8_TARER|nr:hypothetical protein QVD17_32503 [Tagetes erecta]